MLSPDQIRQHEERIARDGYSILENAIEPDLVDALTASLDGKELPLHVETLAVQKLGELADPRSRGAVERFAARVGQLPPSEGLDEELRVEAIEAARTTLSKL